VVKVRIVRRSSQARTPEQAAVFPRRGTLVAVKTVTLYGRDGCHLCDDARAVLERVRRETPFRLVELDIERDDALLRRYLERIPVVAVEGRELSDFFVDERALRAALSSAAP
jgi:glutaredoxin